MELALDVDTGQYRPLKARLLHRSGLRWYSQTCVTCLICGRKNSRIPMLCFEVPLLISF